MNLRSVQGLKEGGVTNHRYLAQSLVNITGAMMRIPIRVITLNLRKARALQVMIVKVVMTTA